MPGFALRVERTSQTKFGRIVSNTFKTASEAQYARRAAHNAGRQTRRVFENTTRTWDHNVQFKLRITGRIGTNFIAYEIQTSDEIWHYLDSGTSVRFYRSNPEDPYISKTTPGVFASGPGGGSMIWSADAAGGVIPRAGIEPRHWSTDKRMRRAATIALKAQLDFQMSKVRRIMRGEP